MYTLCIYYILVMYTVLMQGHRGSNESLPTTRHYTRNRKTSALPACLPVCMFVLRALAAARAAAGAQLGVFTVMPRDVRLMTERERVMQRQREGAAGRGKLLPLLLLLGLYILLYTV